MTTVRELVTWLIEYTDLDIPVFIALGDPMVTIPLDEYELVCRTTNGKLHHRRHSGKQDAVILYAEEKNDSTKM